MSEVGRFHKTASPLCVGSADGTLRREYGFDSVFRLITLKDQIKAVLTDTKERLDNLHDPDTSIHQKMDARRPSLGRSELYQRRALNHLLRFEQDLRRNAQNGEQSPSATMQREKQSHLRVVLGKVEPENYFFGQKTIQVRSRFCALAQNCVRRFKLHFADHILLFEWRTTT